MKRNYRLLFLFFGLMLSTISYGQISAADETFGVVYGASNVTAGNVLLNDVLNSAPATLSTVTITQLTSTNAGISISGTDVVVAGGTPRGSYTLTYKICSIANPLLCATGTVTINTQLIANPDSFYISPCGGGTIGNVLGNGTNPDFIDTLNGVPALLTSYFTQPGNILVPADVVITDLSNYPGFNIDSSGNVNYFGFSPFPTQYTLTYQLCEIAHPSNCSIGYVTINFFSPNIFAGNDDFSFNPIDNTTGGIAGNVLINDFVECAGPLSSSNSIIYINSAPAGLSTDLDGNVLVAPGISPGTYVLNYTVCDIQFGNCGSANAIITVTGPSVLVANYDDFSAPNYPNTTTSSVLTNDTFNGNPFSSSDVILTPLNNPAGFTLNANGTITIAPTVPEETYVIPYQICAASNPSDCYVNYAYVVVLKNRIIGKIKYDATANGCDASDAYLNNITVKNINGPNTFVSTSRSYAAGEYYLIGDVGTNTFSVTGLPSYFTVTPTTQVFNFSTPNTTVAPDFCVAANSNVDDLEIVLIPLFNVVPGIPAYYNIWYKNNGSTTLSGQINFQFDNTKMSFLSSSPSPNTISSNSLVYNYTNIAPFESRLISNVKFQVAIPPTVDSGQIIPFSGTITPVAADFTPTDNTCMVNQTVVNSQDPNDIIVHEGASLTLARAQQEYLHYTIRFQNIGTSEAINIKVLNDLDPKLDWSTFKLISTSHNCRVKNTNNQNEFLFENIYLPGTGNEPLSHGYITYKIKPIATIAVGNVIPNNANIYFDFNAPIATNIATTTIINNLAPTGLACYQTSTLNPTTFIWDITGTQPAAPTGLACYQTSTWNPTTCVWDITGTPPAAPTGLACYQTSTWNPITCIWDIAGTQPLAPTGLACYQTSTWNPITCIWDIAGTQPLAPTGLACYQTSSWNPTTCIWDIAGTQPLAPTGLACYQTSTWNPITCIWDIAGTQPLAPTGLACYQTSTWNPTTCIWDITGTQPALPIAGNLSGNQNICVGLTTTFSSSVTGGTWSSSDSTVATINPASGIVTGIAAGLATMNYTVLGTGSCANVTATRTVTVSTAPSAILSTNPINICSGDSPNIILTADFLGTTFSWTAQQNNVIGATLSGTGNFINPTLTSTTTNIGTVIYSVIPTLNNCVGNTSFLIVKVNPKPLPVLNDGIICVDVASGNTTQSHTLFTGLNNTNYSHQWYLNGNLFSNPNGNNYLANQAGNYSVVATNINTGCISEEVFATVSASIYTTTFTTSVSEVFSDTPYVMINTPSGSGPFQYQLNYGPFQDSNIFYNVFSGLHEISIKDESGCTDLHGEIFILNYPKFFSPNGDTYNDTWNIESLIDIPNSGIYIFDRYGKFVKQISPKGKGWDGTLDGSELPETEYWFTVDFVDPNSLENSTFKSHFSLKR
jgi:gliding motility-associated-like protein